LRGSDPHRLTEAFKADAKRTIIEKLEHLSDVGFAIVLLSPDDFGCIPARVHADDSASAGFGQEGRRVGAAGILGLAILSFYR
jgi:hypothetical protein